MSLLLLIDGYNVIAPVAPPGSSFRRSHSERHDKSGVDQLWLQRERMQLVRRLIQHLPDSVRSRTCVVFDAANPPRDRPDQFQMEGVEVRFAVGYPEADDLLEELIAAHSAPKSLAVVSSDHRVQSAARRRGCMPLDAQTWLDDLLDGRVRLAVQRGAGLESGAGQGSGEADTSKPDSDLDGEQVDRWLREFGF